MRGQDMGMHGADKGRFGYTRRVIVLAVSAVLLGLGGLYSTATAATPCPAGTFGAGGVAPCTTAPAGTYDRGTGNTPATPCPPGTINPDAGSTSSAACHTTPAGAYASGCAASRSACRPRTEQKRAD